MSVQAAYVGIDLAFAKRKRLPVVAAIIQNDILQPLPLVTATAQPPRGEGNVLALSRSVLQRFADNAANYLRAVEAEFHVRIERIAIDAPSGAAIEGGRRACEVELDRRRISCITTPTVAQFARIRERALQHLASGGRESNLPGANQIWMLVGFALFDRLQRDWECIEVFPHAIAVTIGASHVHKRFADGLRAQLAAVAELTGWPRPPEVASLRNIAHGQNHDRLDALMACWIASLTLSHREALGRPPDDAIWIPRLIK
jgi:hypothetical protein